MNSDLYAFVALGSVKCTARAKKAEKLEESRKSFRDKDLEDCNSMQLTNNPRVKLTFSLE